MSISWVTPITNHTASDYMNVADINRVSSNMLYLAELFGMDAHVGLATPNNAWTIDGIPNEGNFYVLETLMRRFKTQNVRQPDTWKNWEYPYYIATMWNDFESCLLAYKTKNANLRTHAELSALTHEQLSALIHNELKYKPE